jgi:hypothetical protein
MEYTREGVRVGPSSHGLGVFALHPLAVNHLLGPIEGQIVEDPQYGSDYCIDLGDCSLEPAPPFRYLNHSCQPNCVLVEYDEDHLRGAAGRWRIWLEILRGIAVDEQLTIDYAWPAEGAVACQCGSAACRGWIVAAEALAGVVPVGPDRPADD